MIFVKHHYILIGVLALFLIIAAGTGGVLFYRYQATQNELAKLKEGPQGATRQEISELKTKVGALMELPANEEPTLATVTDINKLKNQQFFAQAVNGDKVLIFPKSSKAILYRPETNKIIEVASVNLGQNASPNPSPNSLPKLKVAIYNGTNVTGATQVTQDTINQKVTNLEVITRENANKNDYTKTVIVDVTGKQKEAADELAKVLGASVGPIPQGEEKPKDADLLVILGK